MYSANIDASAGQTVVGCHTFEDGLDLTTDAPESEGHYGIRYRVHDNDTALGSAVLLNRAPITATVSVSSPRTDADGRPIVCRHSNVAVSVSASVPLRPGDWAGM